MKLREDRDDLLTCFEPALTVERPPSGVVVVPVTYELSRRLDKYLAVMVCGCHGVACLCINNLRPNRHLLQRRAAPERCLSFKTVTEPKQNMFLLQGQVSSKRPMFLLQGL